MTVRRKAVDLSEFNKRPSAKHPACTCGFDEDGRYNWRCVYHEQLNARLETTRVHRTG